MHDSDTWQTYGNTRTMTVLYRPTGDGAVQCHTMEVQRTIQQVVNRLWETGFEVTVRGCLVGTGDAALFIENLSDGSSRIPPDRESRPTVQHRHIAPSRILEIRWEEDA